MSAFCEGDPNAPILVVGMAPGDDELEADSPFVGPSGKLLWAAAARAGFTRADCYIINTVGKNPGHKKPVTPALFNEYWDAFDEALQRSTAKVGLLLGGEALWRVTGLTGIQGWRGYLVSPRETRILTRHITTTVPYRSSGRGHKKGDPRTVNQKVAAPPMLPGSLKYLIPSLHPAAVIYSGYKLTPALFYDVARAARAMREELVLDPPFTKDSAVAFDIETAGSLAADASVAEIGLATTETAISLPWSGRAKLITQNYLSDSTMVKVAHNIGFDLPRLEAAGVPIRDPIFCTMFACQMLQPDCPKGLNWVASMYLDTYRWKHRKEAPDYNLLDVIRTRQLYDVVRAALAETDQLSHFESRVMPAVRTYVALTLKGLKVDIQRQNVLRSSLRERTALLREQWWKHYPGVNPNSHQQLKKLFYGELGWPVQKDHYGKPSVDKACLKRLVKKGTNPDAVATLLSYKALEDQAEFVEVKLDDHHCVHPSYIPASADDKTEEEGSKRGIAGTGRPQAHDPNIMQVPKEVRTMYVPHDPSFLLVEFDFNQAELRVAAAVSGDANLARGLDGPDLHQAHADRWGCSRTEAKTVAYGTLYGMGARKLKGIFPERSTEECQLLLDRFYADYPQLSLHRERTIAQVQKNRYLVNAFGRRRYFWNPKEDIPAALDFIPQSTVADIVWSSVNGLYEIAQRHGGFLLTTIHDSFLFEIPRRFDAGDDRGIFGVSREAITEIENYLTRPFDSVAPGFYLPVSYSVGTNWGELTDATEEDLAFAG